MSERTAKEIGLGLIISQFSLTILFHGTNNASKINSKILNKSAFNILQSPCVISVNR